MPRINARVTRLSADDIEAMVDASQTNENVAKALECKKRADAIIAQYHAGELTMVAGAFRCVEEYSRGIDFLSNSSAGGNEEACNLMAELRERRAAMNKIVIINCLSTGRESVQQIEARCRLVLVDATVVIDMPKHSPPSRIRNARMHRMAATGYLNNSLRISGIETEKKTALEDCMKIRSDPAASDDDKAVADRTMNYLSGMVTSTVAINENESIKTSFLTKDDLSAVQGMNVCEPGMPRHYIARSFMDKAGPVSMNDGTPKGLPCGVTTIEQISSMSSRQLDRAFGPGSGTFVGESIFWKRYNGILLGKHKWETEAVNGHDIVTAAELWDMRWVFPDARNAAAFHREMLAASREDGSEGYLDGCSELSLDHDERNSLHDAIDTKNLVVFGNVPRKKPKPNQSEFLNVMAVDPTKYLQQYGAVFSVGRIVIKLYVIEGFYPQYGALKRSSIVDKSGIINVAAKAVDEWLKGQRTLVQDHDFPLSLSGVPNAANIRTCSHCNEKPQKLKRCTRCKLVAYCNRDCQLAHYKDHKIICKTFS